MNNIKFFYWLGTLVLFFGILWMSLPHASHAVILGAEELEEHYVHTLQGLALVILGLPMFLYNGKKLKTSRL